MNRLGGVALLIFAAFLTMACSDSYILKIDKVQDAKIFLDGGSISIAASTSEGNRLDVFFDASIDTVEREGRPVIHINSQRISGDSKVLNDVRRAFQEWFDFSCPGFQEKSPPLQEEYRNCIVVEAFLKSLDAGEILGVGSSANR